MATLIDDTVLGTFAIVGEPSEIAPELRRRFHGVLDRVSLHTHYAVEPDVVGAIARSIAS